MYGLYGLQDFSQEFVEKLEADSSIDSDDDVLH